MAPSAITWIPIYGRLGTRRLDTVVLWISFVDQLPVKYIIAASPGLMSLAVDMEIESTDTTVKRCMQALIDCSATGCFIDIEWVKLNNVPIRPLSKPIPVYNVDRTANDAGMITDIADVILHYENHSEHTQLVITHLGKQSLILGYNWLHNHNLEINWQTKDVKMSCCPL
jgi:predicted aspartyl protease